MEPQLRAGIAIYNAGYYHAAHDAWEERWLDLERGTDDERLLRGLIQFTAAVYHARDRNWTGATGLAESAGEYLSAPPDSHRGVTVDRVRTYLADLAADPETIERRRPPALTHEGRATALDDLDFEATAIAAAVLAQELDRFDEAVVERAIEYAREDLAAGDEGSSFVSLTFDFVREREHRDLVYRRLSEHADRRRRREEDVSGLFDRR